MYIYNIIYSLSITCIRSVSQHIKVKSSHKGVIFDTKLLYHTVCPVISIFFAISFKSQKIKCAEIISDIIFYKKLLKSLNMTDAN